MWYWPRSFAEERERDEEQFLFELVEEQDPYDR
jgi:hypothetical protein